MQCLIFSDSLTTIKKYVSNFSISISISISSSAGSYFTYASRIEDRMSVVVHRSDMSQLSFRYSFDCTESVPIISLNILMSRRASCHVGPHIFSIFFWRYDFVDGYSFCNTPSINKNRIDIFQKLMGHSLNTNLNDFPPKNNCGSLFIIIVDNNCLCDSVYHINPFAWVPPYLLTVNPYPFGCG